jgi:hypothetical protein
MKEYSKQFLEAIKHPRIQGMVRKKGDKILFDGKVQTIIRDPGERHPLLFFIPEVYNPKNVYRSLIGMLGDKYTINKYKFNNRTHYDISAETKKKKNVCEEIVFSGEDFQLTLLRAAIFRKTGQIWRPGKKCWSENPYKL